MGNCASIGVMTDIDKAMQAGTGSTSSGFKCFHFVYLWDNEAQKLRCYKDGKLHHCYDSGQMEKIQEGDLITVKLDCDEWKISFLTNNIEMGTLHYVEKNQDNHPMIYSCGCAPTKYKLI